jgi:hypothetical protein
MVFYRLTLLLSVTLMSVGAHFGANMVHGSKYLTEYAPKGIAKAVHDAEAWIFALLPAPAKKEEPAPHAAEPVKGATPPPAPATTAAGGKTVFQHIMMPILEAKCNKCHNADKSKGDLRMDTYELLLKGGERAGEALVPGKPDQSLIVTSVESPDDDDEHMPPEGKEQLTAEEKALLRWWVQSGASATQTVDEATIPAELKATADAILARP